MAVLPDPTEDIYTILDSAGMRAPELLTSKIPMSKKIQAIRDEAARQLREYMTQREELIVKEIKNG